VLVALPHLEEVPQGMQELRTLDKVLNDLVNAFAACT